MFDLLIKNNRPENNEQHYSHIEFHESFDVQQLRHITVFYVPGIHFGISQYSHLLFLSVVKHQGRCPEL
jgi:hypothetical protein